MIEVDTLITGAKVYNTALQKFINTNVTILDGYFFWLTDQIDDVKAKQIIDMSNKYIIPGLIDCHMHIESSMTTPKQFGKAVIPFGTTTVIADAHEIANVAGYDGLQSYMNQDSDLDIFYAIPSSVPSTTPHLETTGGEINVQEVEQLLKDPRVICLGEAMNFKGITSEPDSLIRKIIRTCQQQYPTLAIEGHCPAYTGVDLARFIYSGISSDHTQQTANSILEKVMNGMFVQLQKKSINAETIKCLMDNHLQESMALVTDDTMADDLIHGHLNEIVKLAIKKGLDPLIAIYLSTYTPARRMGLRDRGMIAPGQIADFIVLESLTDFRIESVYKTGKKFNSSSLIKSSNGDQFSAGLLNSVKAKKIELEDLSLKSKIENGEVKANVIQISEKGTFTKKIQMNLEVKEHKVQWKSAGLSLLCVQERYGKNGNIVLALVKGALHQQGAIGSTWAHDHHNIMIIGNDIADMVLVQNKLVDEQGGFIVSEHGAISANVPLPIGGVVSDIPMNELGLKLKLARQAMQRLGYKNTNEIMSFATLSLLVSPEIKVSDRGIFNVVSQKKIKLLEE